MGRKEYRLADLTPDQFFFQAAGDELASFVGQHRAKLYWLHVGLNDNLSISTGITVAITPALILDANVFDFGRGETLAPTNRANAGEENALSTLDLQLRAARQATQEGSKHGQANRDERRQKQPKEKCHSERDGFPVHIGCRKPVRNGYAEMFQGRS